LKNILVAFITAALFASCSGQQSPTTAAQPAYGQGAAPNYAQATATPDGKVWVDCEPIDSGFGKKSWHASVYYEKKIWLLGGKKSDGTLSNEAWLSPDGEMWARLNTRGGFEPFWKGTASLFNNEIIMTGGQNNAGEAVNSVVAIEGVTVAARVTQGVFTPRFGHCAAVFRDRIWVIGGTDGKAFFNDIYSSADAAKWEKQETGAKIFAPRAFFGLVALKDRLYLYGGQSGQGLQNDVWESKDGVEWEALTQTAAFSPRKGFADFNYKERLWLAGGETEEGPASDVWWSVNGAFWVSATVKAGFPPKSGFSAAVAENEVFILGGEDSAGPGGDVWKTK
jgi:hypothetical protein